VLAIIFGTTGELIKLAPVLHRLDRIQAPYLLITTAQQTTQIPTALNEFGLRDVDLQLADGRGGRDLEHLPDIPFWLARVAGRFVRNRAAIGRRLSHSGSKPVVLVHGDTMTTVAGSLMGRALSIPVAHVEAGLRSGTWRSPFPEEVDRRITSKLADIHYAPGGWATDNLRAANVRGAIVDTGANTIRDALALVDTDDPGIALPDEPFGIVSLHRFELLGQPGRFEECIEMLHRASRRTPLVFVDHPVTVSALNRHGLGHYFDDHFRRIPRLRYSSFISLLKRSAFLVTDSGGSQEECAALGLPCLVHREVTERQDGLDGGPVVLTGGDAAVLERFLEDPLVHRRAPDGTLRSPSDVIVADLEARGHVQAAVTPTATA
jgi:UDP-N-acetylglucosamine 2-epimerase (non-hydrolysing)